QAVYRLDDQAGFLGELADQSLLFGLVAVQCAAGQVVIDAAFAAIHADAGQTAIALSDAENSRAVDIVEAGARRAELKLHFTELKPAGTPDGSPKRSEIKGETGAHAVVGGIQLDRRAQAAGHGRDDLGAQAGAFGRAVAQTRPVILDRQEGPTAVFGLLQKDADFAGGAGFIGVFHGVGDQ